MKSKQVWFRHEIFVLRLNLIWEPFAIISVFLFYCLYCGCHVCRGCSSAFLHRWTVHVHSRFEQHWSLLQPIQAFQAGSETSLLLGTIGFCPRAGVLTLDCNAAEKGGKKQ